MTDAENTNYANRSAATKHFEHALDELWQMAVLAGADEVEMAKISRGLTKILEQRASRAK